MDSYYKPPKQHMVGTSDTPFVTGILETMDIDALIAQWGQQWTEWKASIEADQASWTTQERAEYDAWVVSQEQAMDAWTTAFKQDLEDFKTLNESDFLNWFNGIKQQLDGDVVTNLQVQINNLAEREFRRYYGLVSKSVQVNKDSSGNTTSIVETTDEAVSTTTFATTSTGKVITTQCVPNTGNYNYTKTVTIVKATSGTTITEAYTQVAK